MLKASHAPVYSNENRGRLSRHSYQGFVVKINQVACIENEFTIPLSSCLDIRNCIFDEEKNSSSHSRHFMVIY